MSARWNEVDDLELLQMEAEMRDELSDFRAAAQVYADRAWARGGSLLRLEDGDKLSSLPARWTVRGWKAWGAAAVVATVLALAGVHVAHRGATADSAAMVRVHTSDAVSDEALLQQIQSDISSGVPAAMEPLQVSETNNAEKAVQQ